jgi:hypothetical protein
MFSLGSLEDLKFRQILLKGNGVVHGTFIRDCVDVNAKFYFNVNCCTVFFIVCILWMRLLILR